MADEKPTEYVTLVSNDGYEFKLLRSAACIAGTIKKALDPMCMTTNLTVVNLTATNTSLQLAFEKTHRTASIYPQSSTFRTFAPHGLTQTEVKCT